MGCDSVTVLILVLMLAGAAITTAISAVVLRDVSAKVDDLEIRVDRLRRKLADIEYRVNRNR